MGTFKDSLKKWFYTNNSKAASSDARIPLLTASGEPKGSDTMASLALALGGTNTTMPSSKNLNDFNVQGAWRFDAEQYTNTPGNIKVWSMIEVLNLGGSIIQRVTNSVTGDIYERIGTNGGSGWKTWKRIVMTDI